MSDSRVAGFLVIDIGITVLALGVAGLRVWYRWSRGQLATADYLISFAMLTSFIHMILDIIITAAFGYGRHERDLPADLQNSWKTALTFWLIQIFTKPPLMFSKLSVTFVYRRLFFNVEDSVVRLCRIINYTLMVVLTGFFTAATLVSMFACQPIQKAWLPKTPGKCIDTTIMFNYVTSAINISTSLCLIGLPLPVLYMSKNREIEIKQLFGLILFGLVDTAISAVRMYMITDLYNVKEDFTWRAIPTHIIIVVEMNITIIAASLVVMRPCFQTIFDNLFPGSPNASHNRPGHGHSSRVRRASGYIRSLGESSKSALRDPSIHTSPEGGAGITKTVDIEMASQNASTEDILRETRLRNPLDRPEWHEETEHSSQKN